MADRFPLILNTSANQIQEIASGDTLDLTNTNIKNAGIITATSFSGPIVAGAGTSNIVAGIITATQIDLNGDIDVDGHTNLDNVNVGGATTTAGILNITANTGSTNTTSGALRVAGGAGIQGSVNIGESVNIDVDLDVDGHTNLDNLSVAGVSTFTGNADFSAGIDVTGAITATGTITSNDITIQDQQPRLNFVDNAGSPNNPDYLIQVDGGNFVLHDSTNTADKIKVNTDGHIDIFPNTDFLADIDVDGHTNLDNVSVAGVSTFSGNADFSAGIDVTGNATVSGNLSVGGVLTYEDVTNVDSVGIVTARAGVFIPDNQTLKIGNTSAGPDLTIEHVSSGNYNRIISTGYLQYRATSHFFNDQASNFNFIRLENKRVDLRYNGSKKLTTETSGVNITGICTATTFSGSGASLTSLPAANLSGTAAAINGSNITNVNAATVGGIAAGSFLRSDANDVFNCNGNNIAFDFDTAGRDSINFTMNSSLRFQLIHDNNGDDIDIVKHNSAANIKIAGNRILTTADEGTGNGLDADTVDGIQGSNIFTLTGTQTVTGTKTFDCSGYDYNFDYDTSRTLIRIQRSGTEKLKLLTSNDEIYVELANSGTLRFETSLVPRVNNNYDLGSTSLRWANVYVNDLQLSNESKKDTGGNDVDGTWGDWTLQEGENDIFMINNRTGKKYSITMKEV